MIENKHELKVNQLQAYVDGRLDPLQKNKADVHLKNCQKCRDLAKKLGDLDKAISRAEYYPAPEGYFNTFSSRVACSIAQRKMAKAKPQFWGILRWGGVPIAAAATLTILIVISVNIYISDKGSILVEREGIKTRMASKIETTAEGFGSSRDLIEPLALMPHEINEVKAIVIYLPGDEGPIHPPEIATAIEIDIPNGG